MKVFTLIIQSSDNCIELLRYFDKNIKAINALGVQIKIKKIDMDGGLADKLRSRGITRLPVIIAPDKKIFMGLKSIMDLFDKNLSNTKPVPKGATTNDSIHDIWMKELYAGYDSNGKMIPRKDDDESRDMGGDIQRRVASHKTGQHTADTPALQQYMGRDNIGDVRLPEPPIDLTMSTGDDPAGDDMDARIRAAWLDNNVE